MLHIIYYTMQLAHCVVTINIFPNEIYSQELCTVQAEAGSSKTAQVPQYTLVHHAKANKLCNIICT